MLNKTLCVNQLPPSPHSSRPFFLPFPLPSRSARSAVRYSFPLIFLSLSPVTVAGAPASLLFAVHASYTTVARQVCTSFALPYYLPDR